MSDEAKQAFIDKCMHKIERLEAAIKSLNEENTHLAKLVTAKNLHIEFAENRIEQLLEKANAKSPLEQEQVPTLFVGLDLSVTTHRMDHTQIAVWCKGRDGHTLLQLIDNAVDHNSFALLKRQYDAAKLLLDDVRDRLTSQAVDLIRCGIGGNYGGRFYDDAIRNIYEPINKLRRQLNGGENEE